MRVFLVLLALLVGSAVDPAWAADSSQTRSALVIGIGAYRNAPPLLNPTQDAKAIADALAAQDFNVSLVLDADNRTLTRALRDFGVQAAKSDVAAIFYAGHGVQVDGRNYLIPVDARLQRERDLLYEAMPLDLFLGEVSQSRELGIMIMDACRDNPFLERLTESLGARPRNSVGPGLARIDDTPSNTIVALATRANAVAADGDGEHSPYTTALLEELGTPGVELGLFFRKIRDKVMMTTKGRQEPFTFGSMGAKPFYFNPQPPNRDPVVTSAPALELLDNAAAATLAIPAPTDPDDDRLVVQIIGLPRGGAVRIGDRTVLIGDYLTAEQLRAATFRPDGSVTGNAGAFEFKVTDGKGGSAQGAVAVVLSPSNRPPVVAAVVNVRAVVNQLAVPVPTDPDGDVLTVTVKALPTKGKVRFRNRPLTVGQKLESGQLSELRFDAEDAELGTSLQLVLGVADSKGAEATSTVAIAVVAPDVISVGAPSPLSPVVAPTAPMAVDALSMKDLVITPAAATIDREIRVAIDSTLRQEPNASSRRLATLAAGTVVKAIGHDMEHSWFLAQLPDGTKGWLRSTSVILVDAPAIATPRAPSTAELASKQIAAAKDPPPKDPAPKDPRPKAAEPVTPTPPTQTAAVPATTATARTQGNGNSFRDCPQCPILVRVPAGSFFMGRDGGERSERPAHQVTIAEPFALGKYEVTVGEWQACVAATACNGMPRLLGKPSELTPIHNIHWDDANAYVRWLTASTGKRYRLPSEAEWEYAARAGTRTTYWWGDKIEPGLVVCKDCGPGFDRLLPVAVGSQPANPFGLHGMAGGVAEWMSDCWFDDHNGAPSNGTIRDRPGCSQRVLRGGSWRGEPADLAVTTRQRYDQNVRYITNGFRVLRDLD